jgi:hypothetical protein
LDFDARYEVVQQNETQRKQANSDVEWPH